MPTPIVTPLPLAHWTSIINFGSKFYAIGQTLSATSIDGINWVQRYLPNYNWTSVAYNGTNLCLVSNNFTAAGLSQDSLSWNYKTVSSIKNWNSIIWSGSKFCAVTSSNSGSDLFSATSFDGNIWSLGDFNQQASWSGVVAWNGSIFCTPASADANGGASSIAATSVDGITWSTVNLPVAASWKAIATKGNTFCLVSTSSSVYPASTISLVSAGGISWLQGTLPVADKWNCITSNGSIFCAIATSSNNVATSSNGITWTLGVMPSSTNWISVVWNGTIFCAIAQNSTTSAVSYDGLNWADSHSSLLISLQGDVNGSGINSIPTVITTSGVVSGTYGDSATIPIITVNAKGIVTSMSTIPLSSSGTITITGDVTGSGAGSIPVALSNTGVVSGTYHTVTVDSKGRVLSGSNPTTLAGYGITDAAPIDSPHFIGLPTAPTPNNTDSSTSIATTAFVQGLISSTATTLSGDVIGTGSGTIGTSLIPSGVTSGTYGSAITVPIITVNAKGIVTSVSTVNISISNNITLQGDVSGTGSSTIVATLSDTGVVPGTYHTVTVDSKGRVYAGSNPTTVAGYGITDAAPINSPVFTGIPTAPTPTSTDSSSAIATTAYVKGLISSQTTTLSGDVIGTGSGTIGTSLIPSGVTSGTYGSPSQVPILTVNAKGIVTSVTATAVSFTGNITLSGDVVGSGLSTGSINTVLSNTGVSSGTYHTVTVDSKGRVLSGNNPTTLTGYGITDAAPIDSPHFIGAPLAPTPLTGDNSSAIATTAFVQGLISSTATTLSGDVIGTGSGTIGTTLIPSGVTSGTYGSTSAVPILTVNSKGIVTSAGTAVISSSTTLTGDVTGSGTGTITTSLIPSGVSSGTYGSSLLVPVISVNAKGIVTSISTATVTTSGSTTLQGDVVGTGSGTIPTSLIPSGVTSGTYGNAITVPIITVNAKGIVTSVSTTSISAAGNITLSGDVVGAGLLTGSIGTTLSNTGVSSGTYHTVTVDSKGRVLSGSNPTTVAGYGITDAAPIDSPHFIGLPTAPTPTAGDNSTAIATTAFVSRLISLGAATTLQGDVLGSGTGTIGTTLAPSGAISGIYGTTTSIPVITVNAKGLISNISSVTLTAPNIILQGDVNGSGQGTIGATLSLTGIVSGTYHTVTIDSKGRAISGSNPTTIAGYGITDAAPINSPVFTGVPKAPTPTSTDNSSAIATTAFVRGLLSSQTTTLSGDVLGSGTGTIGTTLIASGVTSGTYGSSTTVPIITVNSKGIVTGASVVTLTAGNITLSGDVVGTGTGTIGTTLSNTGIVSGTYKSVTIDSKGRAIAGGNPTTIAGYGITDAAPINSPHFIGIPTAPTPAAGDNSTALATTQFVQSLFASTATTLQGDVVGSGTNAIPTALVASGVTSGSYGNATTIPVITVNSKGIITNVITAAIAISSNYLLTGISTQTGYFGATVLLNANAGLGVNRSVCLVSGDTSNFYANLSIKLSPSANNETRTLSIPANATISGVNTGDQTFTFTGDFSGTGTSTILASLAPSGVVSGTYGGATIIPVISVNSKGIVTNISATTLSSSGTTSITGDVVGSGAGTVPTMIKSSVNLTGTPTITASPTAGDNSTKIATTAFVQGVVDSHSLVLAGDISGTGTIQNTVYTTLKTVNTNVGTFGSASAVPVITADAQGRITAVSTAPVTTTPPTITLSGDISGAGTTAISTALKASGVTSGTYGNAITVPIITVNSKGIVTFVSTATLPTFALPDIITGGSYGGTNQIPVITVNTKGLVTGITTSSVGATTLTGDVTGSGVGSIPVVLATVNSNIGTFGSATQVPVVTIDAKGRVTAVTSTAISATGTTTLAGDVTGSGTGTLNVLIKSSVNLTGWPTIASTPTLTDSSTKIATTAFVQGIIDAQTVSLTGAVIGSTSLASGIMATSLKASGVTSGTYGSATTIPVISVNSQGIVTSVSTATISSGSGSVTLTGDVTGSGAGSIPVTLSNTGVSSGTYHTVTVDSKGRVTAGSNPVTLAGYGITDAAPKDSPTFTGMATFTGTPPQGITVTASNSTTTLATTAFVHAAIAADASSSSVVIRNGSTACGLVVPATYSAVSMVAGSCKYQLLGKMLFLNMHISCYVNAAASGFTSVNNVTINTGLPAADNGASLAPAGGSSYLNVRVLSQYPSYTIGPLVAPNAMYFPAPLFARTLGDQSTLNLYYMLNGTLTQLTTRNFPYTQSQYIELALDGYWFTN